MPSGIIDSRGVGNYSTIYGGMYSLSYWIPSSYQYYGCSVNQNPRGTLIIFSAHKKQLREAETVHVLHVYEAIPPSLKPNSYWLMERP